MSDKQLLFLMSQPRSGSTLLQKILGVNEEIYTRSEPWLMLAPAYAYKGSGVYAEYDKRLELQAVDDFLSEIPGGRDFYTHKISDTYSALYFTYLEMSGKSIFLDKTPRYSLIIDELSEMFPAARQIILIRDPLSVLNSLIPRKSNIYQLSDNNVDLTKALDNLLAIVNKPADNQFIVKYEELVQQPEKVVSDLCEFIGVRYSTEMLNSFIKDERWKFGDQKVYASRDIDPGKCDAWKRSLDNPQYWRVFNDYLEMLGSEKYEELGYDYGVTKQYLKDHCPYDDQQDLNNRTIGLSVLLENPRDCFFSLEASKKRINDLTNIRRDLRQELDSLNKEKKSILDRSNKKISDRDLSIKSKNREIGEKQGLITRMERELDEKAEATKRKDHLIEEKQKLIVKKNEELARRQAVIAENNKTLNEKNIGIAKRDEKIDGQIREITRITNELKDRQDTIYKLNLELENNKQSFEELKRELEGKKDRLRFIDANFKKIDSSIDAICNASLTGHPLKKLKAYRKMLETYHEIKKII